MRFMILDQTGNAVDAFDNGHDARAALRAMVIVDASSASELALVAFDEGGHAVGEPEIAADIGIAADLTYQKLTCSSYNDVPYTLVKLSREASRVAWGGVTVGSECVEFNSTAPHRSLA